MKPSELSVSAFSRKGAFFSTNKIEILDTLKAITDAHRQLHATDRALCEVHCHALQASLLFQPPKAGDFFVGRIKLPPIGFTPQVYTKRSGFGYYCNTGELDDLLGNATEKEKAIVQELREYWKDKDSVDATRAKYPFWLSELLPSDDWIGEPGIAFPLYRMSGAQLDFKKLVTKGIQGLKQEIRQRDEETEFINHSLYDAMIMALDVLSMVCSEYAKYLLKRLKEVGAKERFGLELMIGSLQHISKKAPTTFHEACQLSFLYTLISGAQNYGRMDDYLGEFYVRDLEKGILKERMALAYLSSLWELMDARKTIYDGRAIIGGKGRTNVDAANAFALLALETSKRTRTVLPQLTLRFHEGMDMGLWEKAMEVLGTGHVYPMLYNDDVNIPSVQNAFGIDRKEAANYVPFGCGEYVLGHHSFGTPSGVINLAKALEITLNKGVDPKTEKPCGIPLTRDVHYDTFDELLAIYKKQVEKHIAALALQEKIAYDMAADTAPFLFYSILYDNCIEKGKPIFGGGVRHLGGTLESYGNTNVADSLTAIKKWVFEEGRMSLEQLVHILNLNFEGFEKERKLLLEAPKYGNDNDVADAMVCELHEHLCLVTKNKACTVGLDSYLIVVINNDANVDLGKYTGATADGRGSGETLNNGNAAYHGADREGVTALLNSLLKPRTDIHAGAVQNLKLAREWFTKYPNQLLALLQGYFRNGGAQLMLTVINRDDLIQAMEMPEKYGNLIVRVGGFSARFIDLRRETQLEIITRTLH